MSCFAVLRIPRVGNCADPEEDILHASLDRRLQEVGIGINMNNPFMLRSAYREAIPVRAQRLSIRVPQGATVRGVRLLVSNQTPQYTQSAGRVNLTVPSIVDHEAVAIAL
jgi:hypothetical protein